MGNLNNLLKEKNIYEKLKILKRQKKAELLLSRKYKIIRKAIEKGFSNI